MSDASPVPQPRREDPPPGRPFGSAASGRYAGLTVADPVEEWKRSVCAAITEDPGAGPGTSALTFRVTAGFLLLGAATGVARGAVGMLQAIAVLGSAVLLQELPRALMARALGRKAHVRITAGGGQTLWSGPPLRGLKALGVASAGSVANLLVGTVALEFSMRATTLGVAAGAARAIASSHLVWGALQSLPLVPFRAGSALAERLSPSLRCAHAAFSVVVALALGLLSLHWIQAPWWLALLSLTLVGAVSEAGTAYAESWDDRSGVHHILSQAESAILAGRAQQARGLLQQGLGMARAPGNRERLAKALAWAGIGLRDPFVTHGALLLMPARSIDLHLLAAYLGTCNRTMEALELLELARRLGYRSRETTKLHLDLLFRSGEHAAFQALAVADRALLSARDRQALDAALVGSGAPKEWQARMMLERIP